MLKTKKKFFKISIAILLLFIFTTPVFAVNLQDAGTNLTTFSGGAGYDPRTDIDWYVGFIIEYVLSFLGVIFLCLLIYGGFIWMQARGDSEMVTKAKETIINAAIGLAIVLGAYAITAWVVGNLTSSTIRQTQTQPLGACDNIPGGCPP